jgi:hypothetical protein
MLRLLDLRLTPRQWARELKRHGYHLERIITQHVIPNIAGGGHTRLYRCEFAHDDGHKRVATLPRRYLAKGLRIEAGLEEMDYWFPPRESYY